MKSVKEMTEEEIDEALEKKYGKDWDNKLNDLLKQEPIDELIEEFMYRITIAF